MSAHGRLLYLSTIGRRKTITGLVFVCVNHISHLACLLYLLLAVIDKTFQHSNVWVPNEVFKKSVGSKSERKLTECSKLKYSISL